MPAGYLSNPIMLIINSLIGAYVFILILRVLLQYSRADSHNPVSSFIIKATQAPLKALKPLFPTVKNINLSAIVLMLALQMGLGLLETGGDANVWVAFIWSLTELISSIVDVFIYSIFAMIILSWVNPGAHNPVINLVHKITEPILRPFQRIIPPMGGMDLSPMAALLALQVFKMLALPPLFALM